MIIHGSMAAIIRGAPFNREEGHKSDIDIYGSAEDLETIMEFLDDGTAVVRKIPSSYRDSRVGIVITKFKRADQKDVKTIEFETLPSYLLSAIYSLPDNSTATMFDTEVVVVSELTDSIIKRSYRNNRDIFKQKHQKDIESIKANKYLLTGSHINFFRLLKEYAKDYINIINSE